MEGAIYSGGFLNAIDVKSRVSVPPAIREVAIQRASDRCLTLGKSRFDDCLIAYDTIYAHKLHAEIEASFGPTDSREKALAIRQAFSRTVLRMDDAHRITLTDGLIGAAKLDRWALFVGMYDRFEIWDPRKYLALPDADPELSFEVRQTLTAKGETV